MKDYYVIADLHGRYDLLKKALKSIPKGSKIIFLGDYIDRGPDSGRVLKRLMYPKKHEHFVCLCGNHEDMYRTHVEVKIGWPAFDENAVIDIRREVGESRALKWIKSLPVFHIVDKNVFAHAWYDDDHPPERQLEYDCMWGRFLPKDRAYDNPKQGLYLVHGHTPIMDGPLFAPNRVNLDTGAFKTGRLAVARFTEGEQGVQEIIEVKC